jgi:hypothetical protein
VPAAAVPLLNVSVDVPAPVMLAGLKDAEAPAGRPLTDRFTVCAEPDVTAVEIVDEPLPPWVTDTVDGLADIEKSFVTVPPQLGNLNDPIRVDQLNAPLAGMYSLVNQNVQSSLGSTDIEE